tara:strand:- start:211 stop:846 length:636 start_codon:yes stop_codon:yes gene_type:complete
MKITKTQLRQIVKEEILNEVNSDKKLQELFGIGDKIAKSSFGKKAAKLGRTAQAKFNRALGQPGDTEVTYVGDNHKQIAAALKKLQRFAFRGDPFGDETGIVEGELGHFANEFKSKERPTKVFIDEEAQEELSKLMDNEERFPGGGANKSFEYKVLDALRSQISNMEVDAEEKPGSEGVRVGEFGKNAQSDFSFLIKLAGQLDDKGKKISS